MKITEQIDVLELNIQMGGQQTVIYPVVIYEDQEAILIDTGFPGNYQAILDLIDPAYPVKQVILTHQDLDHIGSLPQFLAAGKGELRVYAHEADQPTINGKAPFLKASPERLQGVLSNLSPEEQEAFSTVFSEETSDNVTDVLHGGETLPFAGGLQVIHTPGHTPGHISLYHPDSKTLFTGDAMVVNDGMLLGPVPHFTPKLEEATESLKAFEALEVERVICYHGGLFEGDFKRRLAEIVSGS